MPTCAFSGEKIPRGRGLMYVLKDGKILWFKNSKCQKNFVSLKRNPRKIKWTQAYRDMNKKGTVEKKAVSPATKKETSVKKQPEAKAPAKEVTESKPAAAKAEETKEGAKK